MTWMRSGSSPALSPSCMKDESPIAGRSLTSRDAVIGSRKQGWSCPLQCACGHSQVRREHAIDVRSALLELRDLITTRAMEPCGQGDRGHAGVVDAHGGL